MFGEYNYKEGVSLFKKILSEEADKLLSNEDLAVIYIGRETCPYCRKFVKKLSELATEISITIYYVDSNNFADNEMNSFREKYNILTIPGFIIRKNGEIEVYCDSSMPKDVILEKIS